jgi:outer membrane receptor protein involved in Fe transport
MGWTGVAHAQQQQQQQQPQQQAVAGAGQLEELFVTGTRIVRRDLEAASPILTLDSEQFDMNSAIGVEAVLNQYPQFNPGATQFSAGSVEPNASNTPGVSTLNMRGLGNGRGLILVDGRRVQPVNAGLTVDTNMIPSAMIANVEVISGGAAATYGSDALAGVVNFKLRRDFEGIRLNYQRGFQEAGDGEEDRADILVGGNFDGNRGNAVFNIAYASRAAAWNAARDWIMEGYRDPETEANYPRISFPAFDAANAASATGRPSQAALAQLFPNGVVLNGIEYRPGSIPANQQFYINPQDGTVFLQDNAVRNGYTGSLEFPYKQRTQLNDTLQEADPRRFLSSPLTRYSAFGRAVYDIADNISAFAQGTFVTSNVWTTGPPNPVTNRVVPRNPAMEPWGLQVLLDSRPNPQAPYRMTEVAKYFENRQTTNDTELHDFTAGLEGTFPNSDWTWEAFAQTGFTKVSTHHVGFLWNDRREAIAQAPNYGRNYSLVVSNNVTLTCTSGLPIFSDYYVDADGQLIFRDGFQYTQDCSEAASANMTQTNTVEQRIFESNFQGKIADVRAGELRGAFGISERRNTGSFVPDPLYNTAVAAGGTTEALDVYGEILYPVFGQFELELGARYSQFDVGSAKTDANTYKALFSWAPIDSLRFRGGYQRAYRSPTVYELFSGPSSTVNTWADGEPCRSDTANLFGNHPSNPQRAQVQELCRQLMYREGVIPGANPFDDNPNTWPVGGGAVATVFSVQRAGNPNLDPELAKTKTFGVVWQAPESNLSVAADWYSILIEGYIDELNFRTAYEQCFNYNGATNPTYDVNNQFCKLIRRNDSESTNPGAAGQVQGLIFNLGERDLSGVDIDVNWRADLADLGFDRLPGEIGIRTSLTYQLKWKSVQVPGAPTVDYKGTGEEGGIYDYQPFTTFSYRGDRLNINLNWRYLPPIEHASFADNPNTTTTGSGSYNLFGLSGGWRFSEAMRLRAGIDNLFNRDPEIYGATPQSAQRNSTLTGRYDPLGRRGFVALEVNF